MAKFSKRAIILALTAMIIGLSLPTPGLAKKPDGHGKKEHGHSRHYKNKVKKGIVIVENDQATIRHYLQKQYHGRSCPPGLAKKHNGCLPPGLAKKYALGQTIPSDAVLIPLPVEVSALLHPPRGYYYAQIDQDVVLVAEATKKIIDAVTLLSAVQ